MTRVAGVLVGALAAHAVLLSGSGAHAHPPSDGAAAAVASHAREQQNRGSNSNATATTAKRNGATGGRGAAAAAAAAVRRRFKALPMLLGRDDTTGGDGLPADGYTAAYSDYYYSSCNREAMALASLCNLEHLRFYDSAFLERDASCSAVLETKRSLGQCLRDVGCDLLVGPVYCDLLEQENHCPGTCEAIFDDPDSSLAPASAEPRDFGDWAECDAMAFTNCLNHASSGSINIDSCAWQKEFAVLPLDCGRLSGCPIDQHPDLFYAGCEPMHQFFMDEGLPWCAGGTCKDLLEAMPVDRDSDSDDLSVASGGKAPGLALLVLLGHLRPRQAIA